MTRKTQRQKVTQHPAQQHHNRPASAAVIIGIISLMLSTIPIISMISWVLAPLAIILGLLGMRRPDPKGYAKVGIGIASFALIWKIFAAVYAGFFL